MTYTANYQNFINSDFLDVDISTDGGTTWTNLLRWNEDHGTSGSPPGVNVSIDLSAYAGQNGLMLRWRYYDPNTGDWNWYAQVDDVALLCGDEPPNIDVYPLSMSSTQPTNTTTQQTLDVGNTGASDLTWNIDEEPAPRPAAATAPSSVSKLGGPTAVQRSAKELQDMQMSATADVVQDGSFEAGTPNPFWTEASTNFGTPLCDAPGCGTGTGTGPLTGGWWAWFGGIAAYEASSVSQSVTIPSGGPATLSFWVEQFVCSGSASDYLEVNIDGTQLWQTTGADAACGVLGYRQVTLDVSAYADGGAHTLEFNSEVFGSGTTNFFVDDVMLDAQGGGGAVCSAPSNVPWLSVNPTNGTTAPAAITPVDVTFDSTGLAAGTYNANLCVTSNDPDAGPGNGTELVIVPVELIVEEAPAFSCEYPEEDFEGGVPPLGWSVVNNAAGGPTWGNIAACGPNGDGGNWTGGAGDAACISASTLTAGAFDAELRTPVFNLVGYSEATFSYLANYQNFSGIDRLNFDISADGGVTWTTLSSWNSDHGAFQSTPGVFPTVDLADYLGMSNLMLRWHYFWNDPAAMGWYAQVDEAEFKCVQGPPTAVTLDGLSAVQAPLPVAGLPLAALPAVVSLALGAAYVLRRKAE
ncbi:MAG: choice-of-anchor J domain-containing protein [Anaerolineae bacterium]